MELIKKQIGEALQRLEKERGIICLPHVYIKPENGATRVDSVLARGDDKIGKLDLELRLDRDYVYLAWIKVKEIERKSGIGCMALQGVEEFARQIGRPTVRLIATLFAEDFWNNRGYRRFSERAKVKYL